MTPQSIITTARHILQDADSEGYRQTDAELLLYVNAGIQETSVLRPDWFQAIGHVECAANDVEQAVTFVGAQKLIDVIGLHAGNSMTEFDLATMQAFNPGWKTDDAAEARQWARHPADPLRFYCYPKAPADQQIDVLYVKNPTAVALNDTILDLPQTVEAALVDYVVYRAEAKDDENVLNTRAAAFYQAFVAKIQGVVANG